MMIIYLINLTFEDRAWKKRTLIGILIGLVFIACFLFIPDIKEDPSWSEFWKLRPLIITPLGGGASGLCLHFFMTLSRAGKINKYLAYIIGPILCFIIFWISVILGLDGTMWN
jgi:hypothetical protein